METEALNGTTTTDVKPRKSTSSTGVKKKKKSSAVALTIGDENKPKDVVETTNKCNGAVNGHSPSSSTSAKSQLTPAINSSTATSPIEDINEEADVVPDLPAVMDEQMAAGSVRRRLSRGKASYDSAESSGEESNYEDGIIDENGGTLENGHHKHANNLHRQKSDPAVNGDGVKVNGNDLKSPVEIVISPDTAKMTNGTTGRRSSNPRRRGVVEQPIFDTISEPQTPDANCIMPPQVNRGRRSSTVDLSRSAQKMLLKLSPPGGSSSPNHDVSPCRTPEPTIYSNPDMEIFRQRRMSQQGSHRRLSLAEALGVDWPMLEVIEKPEYRIKEVQVTEASEAKTVELRKMDPTAIYKSEHWIEELTDVTCIEREPSVTLSCKYSNPNGKVRWFKNRLEVFHGHKYVMENNEGTFSLTLNRVCLEDTGQYVCEIDDKQTSAFLVVEAKQILYQFTQSLPNTAKVRQKADLVLECEISEKKPPVQWRIDGEVIEYTPGLYELFRRDERCILKIRNVPKYLDGVEFSCEVVGDRTACRLSVDEPEFHFTRKLADVDCYEKETAAFECEVNDEEANVKWFKENKQLTVVNSIKYSVVEEGTKRQLNINNVCAADEGLFTCSVQGKQTTAKLLVAPDVVIRERLENQEKVENETVKFQCKVKNPKNYAVKWSKDGKPIPSDERFKVYSCTDGTAHSLTIKTLTLSDNGTYTCTIGDRETSATLTVTECRIPPKVEVETVPRELVVKCGKPFEIYVPYIGKPMPTMKWLKDGGVMASNGGVELEQTQDKCVMRIKNARRGDSADYELQLTNDSGNESVPITVKVIGKPLEPEGPIKVVDVFKDHCHLLWEPPTDDGGLPIDYYLVELQDVAAGGRKWTEVGRVQGDTQCGIPNLEPGKKYKFRVRACNQEGQSEPLATEKEILAKDPWDPPSKPGRPEVVDYDRDCAEIHWTPSENDGGNPIQKYVIELRCLPEAAWQTVGMVPPQELYAIIPNLTNGKTYDFRVAGVNQAGRGEPSDASASVLIKPTRVAPTIDRSSVTAEVKVKSGRDFSIDIRFSGSPAPKVVWTRSDKKDVNCCQNVTTTDSATSSQLTCSKAVRANTAQYELTVTNEYGHDTASVNVNVIGVPDSPVGPLGISEIRKSSAVISWQPPADDGGRPCMNYLVERMNTTTKQWERVSSSIPNNVTQFKVTRLEEGQRYLFRVMAENDQGSGAALVTEIETLAKNPFETPCAPAMPEIVDSSNNFIKIKWNKPTNDGGAAITGYYVERRDKNTGSWIRLNEQPITECEYTDYNVRDKKQYEYRVLAENEGGTSVPSIESLAAKAKPLREQGHIQGATVNGCSNAAGGQNAAKDGANVVTVRAGGPIRIDLQISGSPPPVVTWFKDNQPITLNNRVTLENGEENACFQVAHATRMDSGQYTARVQNELGAETSVFTISVLDVPSSPQMLHIDELFADHCKISWKPPSDDGGSEIIGYSVELFEEGYSVWDKVTSCIPGLSYTVKELRNNRTYRFRIRAENIYGASQPLDSDKIVAKNPFNPPSEPTRPEVADSDKDFILIKWNKPKNDGGSPIQGYIVERKDPLTGKWTRLNPQLLTCTEYRDRAVQAGKQYDYRITAVGAGGSSESSETSGFIKAKPLRAVPTIDLAPSQHSMQAVVGETLTISVPINGSPPPVVTWFKNGQPISSSKRVKCTNADDVARLCIYGVSPEDSGSYTIALSNNFGQANDIINVNIVGNVSKRFTRARSVEPTSNRTPAVANSEELMNHSPSFTFPLRNRLIQQGVGVKLTACIDGHPAPKITWYKDNREITFDSRYTTAFAFGVCSLEIVSCSSSDAGKFTCVASNSMGKAETSCRIVVHERDKKQNIYSSQFFNDEIPTSSAAYHNGRLHD